MKKFLALSLLLGAAAVFVPAGEAKAAEKPTAISIEANAFAPQTQRRWNRRGVRIVTRTRFVTIGGRRYRQVVQYRYRPNGSVTTRVLTTTRIR